MNLNKKKLILIEGSIIAFLIISGIIVIALGGKASAIDTAAAVPITVSEADNSTGDSTYIPPTKVETTPTQAVSATPTLEPFIPATEMDLEPSSITVFVNKEHALPKNYRPEELVVADIFFDLSYYDERTMLRPEAAKAIETMFTAAEKAGVELSGVSGFRSYQRQHNIFLNNIVTKGKDHTLKYSAVPGTSEHQTGLAIDISCKSLDYDLSTQFADTQEGKWVAANAHYYGYIVRYPEGKAKITGYAYEPWHIRYVGRGLANYLYQNNLTLEEYYNYTPNPGFDFEATYSKLINYVPTVTVSLTPAAEDGIVIGENGEIIEEELGEEVDPAKDEEASDDYDTAEDNEAESDQAEDDVIDNNETESDDTESDDTESDDTENDDTQNDDTENDDTQNDEADLSPTPVPAPTAPTTPIPSDSAEQPFPEDNETSSGAVTGTENNQSSQAPSSLTPSL